LIVPSVSVIIFRRNEGKEESMAGWTFITNHAVVLSLIAREPSITARRISSIAGITERAVRKILSDLEKGGFLGKVKEGRNLRYTVYRGAALRHLTQKDKAVGVLLDILNPDYDKVG